MKGLKKILLALLVVPGILLAGTPVETLVPVVHVYSPVGFDSNDSTEIMVEGFLPNLCHRYPMTEVKVIDNKINILVKSLKYDSSNPFCPEMLVPFLEKVKVGLLDKGQYEIIVNGKSMWEQKAKIIINESVSDSVDDHVYTNVSHVEVVAGSYIIKLEGFNPSDCFVLDSVEFLSNGKDTYSVLPKMRRVAELCPMRMVPFSIEARVPNDIERKKVLLHVRAMGGKSVNAIFSPFGY